MARVHAYAPRPAVYRYEYACAPSVSSSRLSGVDVSSIDQLLMQLAMAVVRVYYSTIHDSSRPRSEPSYDL